MNLEIGGKQRGGFPGVFRFDEGPSDEQARAVNYVWESLVKYVVLFFDQPHAAGRLPLKCLSIQLRAISWPAAKAPSAVKNV
jgi:hypothetical protein